MGKEKQCFIPYCSNNSFKNPNKVFISTPSNPVRRKHWFSLVSKFYNKTLRPLATSYCCEDHFDPLSDFENWMEFKTVGTRLKLKSNVAPHILKGKPDLLDNVKPFLKFTTKNAAKYSNSSSGESECDDEQSGNNDMEVQFQNNIQLKTEPVHEIDSNVNENNVTITEHNYNKALAVPIKLKNGKIFRKNKTVSKPASERVKDFCTILKKQSYINLGLPKDQYFLVKLLSEQIRCSYKNILISLKKIRLDEPLARLAKDFLLPEYFIYEIFLSTVPKIANLLETFNKLQTDRLKTISNLPVPHRTDFINVESVINFFVIELKESERLNDESSTKFTTKYLLSVNPEGLINFISQGYPRTTSEINIIKNCGYLDVLSYNTTILGDKNLMHTTTLFSSRNCKLITRVNAPETKEDIDYCMQIETLRKQFEATVLKLRKFKMLNKTSCIEEGFGDLLDFIVIISCALTNLQEAT